jgi:hypothetical protein
MNMENYIMSTNQRIDLEHPAIRPPCDVPFCTKRAELVGKKGEIRYRRSSWVREEFGVENGYVCTMHHNLHYSIGGWNYKIHRKKYCENRDERLGFKCTYVTPNDELFEHLGCGKEVYEVFLHVDHMDGNPNNNLEENLQTLCSNCHAIKTALNRDNLTPGRKTQHIN